MKVTEKQLEIKKILDEFEKEPKKYEGHEIYSLIMERKNLADKERTHIGELKKLQEEIEKKFLQLSHDYTKIKGAIEYVDDKLLASHQQFSDSMNQ